MGSLPTDPYKTLGVGKDADLSTIKTAYRKLVLKCHPDKVQDPTLKAAKQDEFQRVQQAYEILGDDKKRKEYDEDAKLKRLRDELSRGMGRSAATPRSSPKNYNEPHIRTAEPPPSFKPGPPPTSPFSPYGSSSHQFSHSWDRDIPFRTNVPYDEGHRARRTASYEKPRDEFKEERRRRKDDDEHEIHEWAREKERERERDREQDRDRDRDRDRKSRSDREKDDRKDKIRREMEKREKERDRDRARRQDQQEKYRTRKPAYVELNDDSDEDHRVSKKTSSAGIAATASAGGKKHADSARRDKSARRDESPRAELNADRTSEKMKYAADYMVNARRRGSKSGGSHPPDNVAYNLNFPDPDQTWHAGESPRPRRPSQDDKKLRARVISDDGEVEDYKATPEFRPPRLAKSYTSPAGALHMSNSSAPRVPNLSRASTMDYTRHPPPAAPAAPPPESSRHPSKSERRRRGSFDGYDDESRSRRSSTQPRVLHHAYDDAAPLPRTPKMPLYRASDDVHFHHPLPTTGSKKPGFSKVKVAPDFSSEHIYQAKRFSDEDIAYSNVHHSSNQYSSPHASYLHVRS